MFHYFLNNFLLDEYILLKLIKIKLVWQTDEHF